MESRPRKRTRSPNPRDNSPPPKRRRSHSPHRSHHHHHRHHRSHHQTTEPQPAKTVKLPFKRTPLSKHDLQTYKPLLASYLSIQKNIENFAELEEREVKGRWKSLVRKWNEGSLARGWYDPDTFEGCRADWVEGFKEEGKAKKGTGRVRGVEREEGKRMEVGDGGRTGEGDGRRGEEGEGEEEDDESEEDIGPVPEGRSRAGYEMHGEKKSGPAIPTLDDLKVRRENVFEDYQEQRKLAQEERKVERKMAKDRLDELVPRAEAGSRERMLEKKREKSDGNRAFREAREGGGVEEVADGDLMGGDEGIERIKKKIKEQQKMKNEREIRREEIARARAAEREERMEKYRAKERNTMNMLQELARQRFGGGD